MEQERIFFTFKELGLVLCKADTKRKITCPIYDKLSLRTIGFLYYAGNVLRDINNPKKYYSKDEIREKVINKLKEISI